MAKKCNSNGLIFNNEFVGKEKLNRLNVMTIPLLAVKLKETPNNQFLQTTAKVVNENPERLTDRWIDSINKWVDAVIAATMLDEPDMAIGSRYDFGPFRIYKIQAPSMDGPYMSSSVICIDERGWKWFLKTGKAYEYSVGDKVTFSATIKSHKDGITFLGRASKIQKIIDV